VMENAVYRLKSWKHFGRKGTELSYAAPKKKHTVVLCLGHVAEDEPVTEEWLRNALRHRVGLIPEDLEIRKEWGIE